MTWFEDDPFDYLILPEEPLVDGWVHKWDDASLDYRFERYGLALKSGPGGYSILHSITGKPLTVPELDYEAVDRPFVEICEVLLDLEIAEILKRKLLDGEDTQVFKIEHTDPLK